MAFSREVVRWEVVEGAPLTWGDSVVTPESKALVVQLPWGGIVWHRPIAARLEQNGQVVRIPIHDVTRIVQLLLIGISVFALITMLAFGHRDEEKK